jgi:hypothetical protein
LLLDEVLSEVEEAGLYVGADLGTGLDDLDSSILCECIHVLLGDLGSLSAIRFVADDKDAHVVVCVFLHLLEPTVEVEEGLPLEEIEYEDYPVRPSVIGIRNCSIAFLPRGIPYLQFDLLVL